MMNLFRRGVETLRQPDRNPRCYELTDQEREAKIREWQARNVWNTLELAELDHPDNQMIRVLESTFKEKITKETE
jgi:hypothetical protein